MEPPEQVEYDGVIYKRNPTSDDWPKRVYYQAPRKSGRGYLHRDIYADVHGKIPSRAHIHHIDENPFNNDPMNLLAMTPSEHQKLHRALNGKFDEERMEIHRRTTLAAAAEWHGSEAGLAWHREHGKRIWEDRKPDGVFICPECEAVHEGYFASRTSGQARYCSSACRQRGDRRSGKHKDWGEEVSCAICGGIFKRLRVKQKTCSRKCGAALQWRTKRRPSEATESAS